MLDGAESKLRWPRPQKAMRIGAEIEETIGHAASGGKFVGPTSMAAGMSLAFSSIRIPTSLKAIDAKA